MTETRKQLKSFSIAELKKLAKKKKSNQQAGEGKKGFIQKCQDGREYFPLTAEQKGIWILDKKFGDSRAYNNPFAITYWSQVPFDPELASKAVGCVVRKHAALRTVFTEVNGEVMQRVTSEDNYRFDYDDFSRLPETEQNQRIMQIARDDALRLLDLEHGPLTYLRMIKSADNKYVLVMTFHHIMSDGWTVNLFLKEFGQFYMQLASGQVPDTKGGFQYTDYALFHEQWLDSDEYKQGLEFWKDRLAGVEGQLNIPSNRLSGTSDKEHGSMVTQRMDAKLWQQIQDVAKSLQVSGFPLFMAAYQLLLHFYSGQSEVVIGSPFANRNIPETQHIMGLMMNTLPLCTEITPELTLDELIQNAKTESDQVFAHQSIPFTHIVQQLPQAMSSERNPLYQVLLTYQVFPFYDPNKIKYETLKVDYGVSKLDLNLWVEREGDTLMLTLYYNPQLFGLSQTRQMLTDLVKILHWLVACPHLSIRELSLLDQPQDDVLRDLMPAEQSVLLTVYEQFKRHVLANPGACALHCEGRSVSYEQLDRQATQIASWLMQQGIRRNDVIALQLPKNESYVAAIFGVWKSGASYLPVDLGMSDEQLERLAHQAKATLLLGDSPRLAAPLKYLDIHECPELKNDSGVNSYFDLDLPAYVLFTSGSTGNPKGVEVTHRQLAHYCDAITPVLSQSAGHRYGMFSSFNTDLAHTMLFPSLIQGGCLEILSAELLEHPAKLQAYLHRYPLDCAKITPSFLSALIQVECPLDILPSDLLVLGGESLSRELIEKIRATGARCRIVNHYGPTETTVGVACFELPAELPDSMTSIPIGKPLMDSQLLILDAQMKVQPIGLPGEIYIISQHMSNGYCGQPGPSQSVFVEHPLLDGTILYRTGDRGVRLDDGDVVFLGRIDRQVKIRGYRVELAEVEYRLSSLCHQRVAVRLDTLNERERLIAFVAGLSEHEQREYSEAVAKELPTYMIPDHWQWIQKMPLTPSGKIDYQQLGQIKLMEQQIRHRPETSIESQLHQIFADVLGQEAVDTHRSFFELGGNSLSALKLVIQVNQLFDQTINVGDLFKYSSISQLATFIDESPIQSPEPLVCLQAGDPEHYPTVLLIHPAGGNVLCYQGLVHELGVDLPVYAIQVVDFTQCHDYDLKIESLAGVYLQRVKALFEKHRLILGGWSLGATIAFEMAIQLSSQGIQTPRLLVLDQPAPQVQIDHSAQMDEAHRLAYFASKVSRFMGKDLMINASDLAALDETQRSALFFNEFRRAGLVPENLEQTLFGRFIDILKAHIEATDVYSGQHYSGEVIVVEAQSILKGRIKLSESGLGWQNYTDKPLIQLSVAGDHLSMLNLPYVLDVAKQLKRVLV
ncbi:MAG: D-alanine--D-alanyl carrier protein ligase [Candidatus Celerinatantimonas neptuna]|nr:MAG: D-alanine--D-alanyl carrier protein ligase [Candidatus Celerinatantimonas neptuna]